MKYKAYPSYKDSEDKWLGSIPAQWEVKSLKSILQERKESNNPIKTKNILSLCMYRGVIPYSEKGKSGNKAKDDLTAYKLAYPNDIVLNSMNVVAGSVGLSKYFGVVSPVYYMLRPRKEEDVVEYFNDIFQAETFQKSLFGLGNGILVKESESTGKLNTIRMRISMEKLNTVYLPYPPASEQQVIANYLEKATAKIDTLIDKQTKLIELLKEKRQVVISTAVTRGLDNTVAMKDSGVEWLGEIPEHWGIGLLSSLFISNKNKNTDLSNKNLLSLSYGRIIRKNIDSGKGLLPENFNTYQIVKEGYIILRLTDLQNDKKSLRTGYVNEKGIITSAYIGLAKKSNSIGNERYFHLYLHTFDIFKGFYGMGSGVRQGLNFDELKKLKFTLPLHEEQNKIVEYIDDKTSKIDNLIIKATKAIDLLKEKRTALISSAVTGKIDVRDIA